MINRELAIAATRYELECALDAIGEATWFERESDGHDNNDALATARMQSALDYMALAHDGIKAFLGAGPEAPEGVPEELHRLIGEMRDWIAKHTAIEWMQAHGLRVHSEANARVECIMDIVNRVAKATGDSKEA